MSTGPRVPRVGLVSAGTRSLEFLQEGLREAGYVPGRTVVIEHRRTEGRAERYAPAVDAVLKSGVEVIVVGSTHGLNAARSRTQTLPIVAVDLETDPVAIGVAASLSRPGGNVTGLFLDLGDLGGKLLQLLREAMPGVARIAALYDPVIGGPQLQATQAAARPAGITILATPVQKAADLSRAVETVARDGARALVVLAAPLMRDSQARSDELALRHRLPSVTLFALLASGVGFMSYGPDLDDMYRRSGSYVDRILKGARVGRSTGPAPGQVRARRKLAYGEGAATDRSSIAGRARRSASRLNESKKSLPLRSACRSPAVRRDPASFEHLGSDGAVVERRPVPYHAVEVE